MMFLLALLGRGREGRRRRRGGEEEEKWEEEKGEGGGKEEEEKKGRGGRALKVWDICKYTPLSVMSANKGKVQNDKLYVNRNCTY